MSTDLVERLRAALAGRHVVERERSFLFAPLRPHPRFQALLQRMNLA